MQQARSTSDLQKEVIDTARRMAVVQVSYVLRYFMIFGPCLLSASSVVNNNYAPLWIPP